MNRTGTTVEVLERPPCDICTGREGGPGHPAVRSAAYDGKTHGGGWAYMCAPDFSLYGIGLGVGRGQKLVLVA